MELYWDNGKMETLIAGLYRGDTGSGLWLM